VLEIRAEEVDAPTPEQLATLSHTLTRTHTHTVSLLQASTPKVMSPLGIPIPHEFVRKESISQVRFHRSVSIRAKPLNLLLAKVVGSAVSLPQLPAISLPQLTLSLRLCDYADRPLLEKWAAPTAPSPACTEQETSMSTTSRPSLRAQLLISQ
jgi:hypothetical protein